MKALLDWLDDRTGYRYAVSQVLYENIPGGSRWRYVWGSTLVFAFVVQLITGIFLWASYSPNAKGAWESVYFIQYEMQGGWMLRGIHHFMAHAMIVLLALHFLQVIIDGAYRAPREVNFWTGLILLKIVLALSLTGYLLPWDQRGFRATQVSTNLMALVPFVGESIQRVVVGGPEYGHATLTRFFALHAGVLPATLIAVLALHMYLYRRHRKKRVGVDKRPPGNLWPDQILKDAVACLAVLAVVMFLVLRGVILGTPEDGMPIEHHLGAHLGPPADPSTSFPSARPEWYFLFLFQTLKYFPGESMVIGAIVIPGIVMIALFLMPLIGRWEIGHGFNIALVVALLGTIGFLSFLAVNEDMHSEEFQLAKEDANRLAARAVQLVQGPQGIPDSGAVSLLRNDPKIQGPLLFTAHCSSCHSYEPVENLLAADPMRGQGLPAPSPVSGPNLYKFGTREWMAAFLNPHPQELPIEEGETDEVAPVNSMHFFGGTAHLEGEMASYITDTMADEEEWTSEQIDAVVQALAAESGIEPARQLDEAQVEEGRVLLQDEERCAMCHKFNAENDFAYAPDLSGYASREWLIEFISNPADERFYGDSNDRMPAFYESPHDPLQNRLSRRDLEMIVDWLRTDWYEPVAGDPDQALTVPAMIADDRMPDADQPAEEE